MIENLQKVQDSLRLTENYDIKEIGNNVDTSFSLWFWVAVIEFLIIAFLIYKSRRKKVASDFGNLSKDKFRQAKSAKVDMTNLMSSINNSKDLYKELSRVCHPDRFINSDKQELAQEIFQEITENKRDFNKLMGLKSRMKTELDINFKI